MKSFYMDHAATTPLHKDVLEVMTSVSLDIVGNPSSIHSYGRKARKIVDEARYVMASSIGATDKEIIFTSGGTEADNLALIGVAFANKHQGKHVITTKQEHQAVLHAAAFLEENGFKVTYLPVYEDGKIEIKDLIDALTDETILVSIMSVNNETGMIQPVQAIGELLKNHQAHFHTDAVQSFGLLSTNVKEMGIDLLTVSAHKINGPKGLGFLYVANDVKINALQHGGEQERKRRAGTENVAGIAGFQKAVELILENKTQQIQGYGDLKRKFLEALTNQGIEYTVNGDISKSVVSIVNISFPGANVETLLTNLDLEGIAASSGSACTAGTIDPSHVLTAMYGEEDERTMNSIRFSFGLGQTTEMIEEAANRVAKIINRLTIKEDRE